MKQAEDFKEPMVDGFRMSGKLRTNMDDIAGSLASLSFLEVSKEKDGLNAVYVESRDINKNPYIFSILRITPGELDFRYTIPSSIAPRKRRIDMIRYVINILTLIEANYSVDLKALYQLIEDALENISEFADAKTSKLIVEYDVMKKEAVDLRKTSKRLREEGEALRNENYELKNRNDDLSVRLKKLEGFSDETIKSKLQEWVAEHSGEVNIHEFAELYKTTESRVEHLLNQLVLEGYLESAE